MATKKITKRELRAIPLTKPQIHKVGGHTIRDAPQHPDMNKQTLKRGYLKRVDTPKGARKKP